jgi:hypothetical protein
MVGKNKIAQIYCKIARFPRYPPVLGGGFNAMGTEEAADFNAKETRRLPVAGFNAARSEEHSFGF